MACLQKDSNGIFLSRKDQTLRTGYSSPDPQKPNILFFSKLLLNILYEIAKDKAEDED